MKTTEKLSNIQIELINMFNYNLSDEQLNDLKDVLSNYFANQVTTQMDDFFEKNNFDSNTISDWAAEHMRSKK